MSFPLLCKSIFEKVYVITWAIGDKIGQCCNRSIFLDRSVAGYWYLSWARPAQFKDYLPKNYRLIRNLQKVKKMHLQTFTKIWHAKIAAVPTLLQKPFIEYCQWAVP
jgi:hypothetical protein